MKVISHGMADLQYVSKTFSCLCRASWAIFQKETQPFARIVKDYFYKVHFSNREVFVSHMIRFLTCMTPAQLMFLRNYLKNTVIQC